MKTQALTAQGRVLIADDQPDILDALVTYPEIRNRVGSDAAKLFAAH